MLNVLRFMVIVARIDVDIEKNLRNTRKNADLPKIKMGILRKIYYFFSPYAKFQMETAERLKKSTRRYQNQRYYQAHRDEIRAKRKEYYEMTGK